ncbi:hypothetical protein [Reyranella sp.]|uniref:hypothetical protein n=1 Tax=Reyranella sp. TaxID=1929291 RepID=UPI002627FA3E|nr:hypothetical protein [Reyranella sp.]HQS18792.1 hypothetical protein [Reyranella sp.]HQT14898.1 hypothetical protein [Reyranella sp.]
MIDPNEDPRMEYLRARRAEAEAAEIEVVTEIAAQRATLDGLTDQIDALLRSITENNVRAFGFRNRLISLGGSPSADIIDAALLRRQIIGRISHKAVRG